MKTYISTRNKENKLEASEAIIKGLAEDGGLFTPETFEEFELESLKDLDYPSLTEKILASFLTDFSEEQIKDCIREAYQTGKFDSDSLVELKKGQDNYYLELWHGPTSAFKDMALTLLPLLLRESTKIQGDQNKIVILTATSGDTGKAALEGFKDVEGTEIIVFYPSEGVSDTQRLQMITTEGNNTHVVGIKGNFDDAQRNVKEVFNDTAFNEELRQKNILLSSANSINIGRLLPQIVYYFYAYFELVNSGVIELGEPVDFVVPTGNFGDILAGYYAKKTGLPIDKLICASNSNKILTDFFTTGVYDANREFYKTTSPSMDILISSNLERLLYDKLGEEKVRDLMKDLAETGKFEVDKESFSDFLAGFATEEEVRKKIKQEFESSGILIDPHTAVGAVVADTFKHDHPVIVLSTANPYKFSSAVCEALYNQSLENTEALDLLSEKTKVSIPEPLVDIDKRKILHKDVIDQAEIKEKIKDILDGN